MAKRANIFKLVFVFFLALSGVFYFSGLVDKIKGNAPEPAIEIKIKEFKADKENYFSYEKIEFSALILSSKNIENVQIKIRGIESSQKAYIEDSKTVSLAGGENIIRFQAEAPYCTSGCGGIFPGPYDIHFEVFSGENLLERTQTVINLLSR